MDDGPRTAIVTGGAKRVGRAIAQALLQDGWTVVAHTHSQKDEVPDGAIQAVAELTDPNCAAKTFEAAADLPPIRLLVNNAARFQPDGLGSFDTAEFDAHMQVNVRAPVLMIEQFTRSGAADGDRLVVNLLDAKLAAPNPDFLSYTLSKQALAGLTELAARELAAGGIRVNAIAPALMLRSNGQSEANFEAMRAFNPLRRPVEPSHVIAALRYLIDTPSVTGQVLGIDGGQRFWSLARDVQFLERK